MIEFALVLPLFLLLALGMMDLGKAFNYWNDANHIAAQGARFAAVNRNPDGDPGVLAGYILSQADTPELRDGGTQAMAGPAQVCVRFPNGTSDVGDPVEVVVTAEYGLLPFVSQELQRASTSVTLTGRATMRIEVPPDYGEHCS